jgi:uncharacterized protein (DUF488 family)
MQLYTIGFTQKSAEVFFGLLRDNGVQRLVDIRRHPDGQLSAFAKSGDLPYFLKQLANCEYTYLPDLAPTDEILSSYRKDHKWPEYAQHFDALMDERGIPNSLDRALFEKEACCLLCSEATPDKCHRRLVAERLARHWPDLQIVHLV